MIRRILVPLDGSRYAEMVLFSAAAIARRSGAELRLIRVYDPEKMPPMVAADLDRDRAWTYIDRIRRSCETADHKVTAVIRVGHAGEEILHEAEASRCDLIVMAAHSRAALWRLFLGSVADHCVHRSRVPVFLVRSEGDSGAFDVERVVISVAGTPLSEEAIPVGLEFARLFDVPIALVRGVARTDGPEPGFLPDTVITSQQQCEARCNAAARYLEGLTDRLRKEGASVTSEVIVDDRPVRAILASARDDLVVMATHDRGPMIRAVVGSVADTVLHKSSGPVLVVPARGSERSYQDAAAPSAWGAEGAA